MLGSCSLFIPACSPRMINAGFSIQADSLIFDMEDAVHQEEKDSARRLLSCALPLFAGRNTAIRINDSSNCWREDLELVRSGLIRNVVVPKARAVHLKQVSELLDKMESEADIAALIESPDSLEELSEIVSASKRIKSLLLGGEDYSLELGVERTGEGRELFYARAKIANTASAFHLEALDTPFVDTDDQEGLERDSRYARGLGFTGKLAINPLQIETIQGVFRPSEQEIQWAARVMEAAALPENQNRGAFSLDGRMIDLPVIRRAEKTLARAGRILV